MSRVEAKDADKEELLQVGSKLLLVSNKTAAELCPRPGVQEVSATLSHSLTFLSLLLNECSRDEGSPLPPAQ